MDSKMKEEEEPLSPVARLLQDPRIDCSVVIKFGCKTKINPDVIIDSFKLNVFKHPRFCSVLANDGSRWLRTDVNVDEHVFVPYIDPKEAEEDSESFIEDYISHITMIPLDRSKPLWELHILNVKTSDAEAICVVRSHHSLGDGASIISLILASFQNTSDLEAFPTLPALKRSESFNHRDNLSFFGLVLAIWSTLRLIWNTFVDSILCIATIFFLKDTETTLRSTSGELKKFSHRIVSLDDIKLIKNTMKMTINDVLLGATEAALTRYLHQSHEEKPKEEGGTTVTPNTKDLLEKIRLRSLIVVNLRPTGIEPLADMMARGSKCRWGNYISIILFPFSIALQSDPLVYLLNVKSKIDRKKHSLYADMIYSISAFIHKVFGVKLLVAFHHKIMSNTTMCISNVIGPVEEMSFHGHPIAYFAPSVYGFPQALTIHYASYANKMIISIAVDPMIIDAHKLCDELEGSLETMKVTLLERGIIK